MSTAAVGLKGRFTLRAVRADGTVRAEVPWFDNLILDNGLNLMGAGTVAPLAYCAVGSGSTAPANAQTQLSNLVASSNNRTTVLAGNEAGSGYYWARVTYRFAVGAATGNLSEVGVGVSGTNLFSRALILDGTGTPTTITVLADEFLDVVYELRAYWPTTDITGTLTIDGNTYNYTLRASEVGAWANLSIIASFGWISTSYLPQMYLLNGGTLGDITVPPGGSTLGGFNGTWPGSYSNNSYQRAIAVTADTSITTSFDKALVSTTYQGKWKISFSPAIPKTNANTFTLNTVLSWARRSI